MNFENEGYAKGVGFISIGAVALIISIPSFIEAAEGKHFSGVYGTIFGIFFLFDGIRRIKKSLSTKK